MVKMLKHVFYLAFSIIVLWNINSFAIGNNENSNVIKISGGVNNPGSYAYQSPVSLLDVMAKAGGPTAAASTNNIQIQHSDGQTIAFNLDDYTQNSNHSSLPTIQPGDKVYIPNDNSNSAPSVHFTPKNNGVATPIEQQITILGAVKKPGKYKYDKSSSLIDMLATAGGPTRFASISNIRLTHLNGVEEEFNLELYSRNPSAQYIPQLQAGDTIYISEKNVDNTKSWITSASRRSIQVIGAVYRPGKYDWTPDLTILDILSNAGGTTSLADMEHIRIVPSPKSGSKQPPTEFNLTHFIQHGGSIDSLPHLEAGSIISVPELNNANNDNSKPTWIRQSSNDSIYIFGEVGAPGRYAYNRSMGFLDIISAANGPTINANISDIRVIHRDTLRPQISKVDLGLFFKTGDPSLLPNLVPQDAIYIPNTQGGNWAYRNSNERVKILGAVARPDSYPFNEGTNVMDILVEAGGPTVDALVEHIVVVHPDTGERQAVNFDLEDYAKSGNPKLLPILRSGDIVYVPFISQGYYRKIMDKVNDVANILISLKIAGVI